MQKKVSVIIPCYNAEKYLDECLDSLQNQSIGMEYLEVILVNDASTDQTGAMLEAFEQKYPESVMVIHLEKNCKQGGARNIGLSYASGEYVVFLDADDFIEADFYEDLYRIATKYNTDIVQYPFWDVTYDQAGNVIKEVCTFQIRHKGYGEITNELERKQFLMGRIMPCGSQSKFYKRTFLLENGATFLEGVAFEEPSFVYPLLYTLERYYWYDIPKYHVRLHAQSTMQSYVRQKGKLYDHPYVQLRVYEQMRETAHTYNIYKEEIDYYFLFTFYYETIMFAAKGGLYLGYDYFQIMKESLSTILPDWKNNKYLNQKENLDVKEILENAHKCGTFEDFTIFFKKI